MLQFEGWLEKILDEFPTMLVFKLHHLNCFQNIKSNFSNKVPMATSRSQGKIAQSPKEPFCIYIIRIGIQALKTGPLLLQGPTGMSGGGAICAVII